MSVVATMIQRVWIAIDPDHPGRRIAFGNEEPACSYADKLTPAWTVRPTEDPKVRPITGTWEVKPARSPDRGQVLTNRHPGARIHLQQAHSRTNAAHKCSILAS